jgi:hypothetical protein
VLCEQPLAGGAAELDQRVGVHEVVDPGRDRQPRPDHGEAQAPAPELDRHLGLPCDHERHRPGARLEDVGRRLVEAARHHVHGHRLLDTRLHDRLQIAVGDQTTVDVERAVDPHRRKHAGDGRGGDDRGFQRSGADDLARPLERPGDDDVERTRGVLDAGRGRERGPEELNQAVTGEQVVAPEKAREREDGVAAEQRRSVHPEPERLELRADVRTRVERPEGRVERAHAGADQEIRLEPGPRQHVQHADLEGAQVAAAAQHDGYPR